jgi:hypothetical protein
MSQRPNTYHLFEWFPGDKVTHLTIIPVIGEEHLGPDHEYLAIQGNNTAVIAVVLVLDGHAHIKEDAMAALVRQ